VNKLFEVSKAKSDMGTCRICRKLIEKGTERIKSNLGSGFYYKLYHIECFVNKYGDTINKLFEFPLCEDCGISNMTVVLTAVPTDTGIEKKALCDYCIRDYEQ